MEETKNQDYTDGKNVKIYEQSLKTTEGNLRNSVGFIIKNKDSKMEDILFILRVELRRAKNYYQGAMKIKRKYNDKDYCELNHLYRSFIGTYRNLRKEIIDCCYKEAVKKQSMVFA